MIDFTQPQVKELLNILDIFEDVGYVEDKNHKKMVDRLRAKIAGELPEDEKNEYLNNHITNL